MITRPRIGATHPSLMTRASMIVIGVGLLSTPTLAESEAP